MKPKNPAEQARWLATGKARAVMSPPRPKAFEILKGSDAGNFYFETDSGQFLDRYLPLYGRDGVLTYQARKTAGEGFIDSSRKAAQALLVLKGSPLYSLLARVLHLDKAKLLELVESISSGEHERTLSNTITLVGSERLQHVGC